MNYFANIRRLVVKVGTSTLTHDTGKLNLRGVLQTVSEMGIPYAIVEQDFQYHLTELETLTAAYLNMKETGFVDGGTPGSIVEKPACSRRV